MTSPGRLGNNAEFIALANRVAMLEQRLNVQQRQTNSVAIGQAKRFRIGAFLTQSLISAGGTVTGSVTWSTPLLVDAYNVDVAVAIANGTAPQVTVVSMDRTGVTVSFPAPVALLSSTVVIVFGIAPATS